MRSQRVLAILTALTLLVLSASPALADGVIIPMPPPPRPPMPLRSLAIKYHRVTVTIEDQVATTRVDQVLSMTIPLIWKVSTSSLSQRNPPSRSSACGWTARSWRAGC
jgi:hypothetical protein